MTKSAGPAAGAEALTRAALKVIVRKATATRPAATGGTIPAVALFAGGVAVGLAGALLLPRARRREWERHADRALRIAGDIGLVLANEALRSAQDPAPADRPAAARPALPMRLAMASAARRLLRRS